MPALLSRILATFSTLCLVTACVVAGPDGDQDPPPRPGMIEGRLHGLRGFDSARLDGFEVRIDWLDRVATSDEQGRFRIWGVPPGDHLLRARRAEDGAHGVVRVRISPGEEDYVELAVGTTGGSVEGSVLHGGEPVAGAWVYLEYVGSHRQKQARTGPDGRFIVDPIPDGTYRVTARWPSSRQDPASDEELRGLLSDPRTVEVDGEPASVDVPVREGVVIAGVVRYPDGTPVTGARVGAEPPRRVGPTDFGTATTDADGRFRIGGLRSGVVYDIDTPMEETHLAGAVPDVRAPAEDVTIEVDPAGSIVVRVLDEEGEPVEPSVVYLEEVESGRREGVGRRDDGRPRRARYLSAGTYRAFARAPGYPEASGEPVVLDPPGEATTEVRLRPGASVGGRVLGPDGLPLAGARVFVLDTERTLPLFVNTRRILHFQGRLETRGAESWARQLSRRGVSSHADPTGEDGRFVVRGPGPGEHPVVVLHPEYPLLVDGLEVPGADRELRMEPGATLEGSVLGSDGEPVANGLIHLEPLRRAGRQAVRPLTALEEEGRFSVGGVRPGRYEVVVSTGGSTEEIVPRVYLSRHGVERTGVEVDLTADETSEVTVELGSIPVVGRLVRAGRPVGRATLTFHGEDGLRSGSTRTDERGRFRTSLRPGTYRVAVMWGPNARPSQSRLSLEVPEGDEASVELELPTPGIAGRVVDEAGHPVSRARVALARQLEEADEALPGDWSPEEQVALTQSREDGTFRFRGLQAGRSYVIRVLDRERAPERVSGVTPWEDARPSDPEAVEIGLEEGASVTVQIRRPGEPVSEAYVLFEEAGTGTFVPPSRLVAEGGRLEARLSPGRYDLHVHVPGGARFRVRDRAITDGATIEVEAPPPHDLLLRVLDDEGGPVAETDVILLHPDGVEVVEVRHLRAEIGPLPVPLVIGGRTDEAGEVRFEGLAAGPYRVRLLREEIEVEREIRVREDDPEVEVSTAGD